MWYASHGKLWKRKGRKKFKWNSRQDMACHNRCEYSKIDSWIVLEHTHSRGKTEVLRYVRQQFITFWERWFRNFIVWPVYNHTAVSGLTIMLILHNNVAMTVPWHRQYSPLLVVVTVTLIDVLLEHSENSHHADSLLTSAVDAVFVSIQHAQGVIGRLQTVKTWLDEIFMNFNLKDKETGTSMKTGNISLQTNNSKWFELISSQDNE